MDDAVVVQNAMSVPGATFPREVRHLYQLALQAPMATYFVELGTYQGRTLVALAYAARQRNGLVLSIDNYEYDEPGSIPSSPATVRRNLDGLHLGNGRMAVRLTEGDSRVIPDVVRLDIEQDIGLLFVDSMHTKAHFDAEMETWLPHVVAGGIVACHDFDSPRWLEMTGAIQGWFNNERYECLGCERRMIGYRRLV